MLAKRKFRLEGIASLTFQQKSNLKIPYFNLKIRYFYC